MLPGDAWLDLLRKSAQHPLVTRAMAELGMPRTKIGDTRWRAGQGDCGVEYRSWHDKGVSMRFERDGLRGLTFWSNRFWKEIAGFSGPLPYGVSLDWTRAELHQHLGVPTKSNELVSTYEFPESMVRLLVEFGMEGGDDISTVTVVPLEHEIVIY